METQSIQILESKYSGHRPLRTLLHVFDGEWHNLVYAMIFYVMKHSPAWAMPIIVAGIINVVTSEGARPIGDLYRYATIMGFLIAQNLLTNTLFIRFLSRGIRNMEARLRSALVRKMQQLTIAFHNDFRSGKLHSKVLRDVESLEMLARQFMNAILPAIITIGIALTVTVNKEPVIALFYLFTVPVSAILVQAFKKKVRSHNAEYRNEVEDMSARVSEMIEMIPVTRAHGAEGMELDKMHSQLKRVRDRGIRLDQINALFGASSWASFQSFHLLCLVVTGAMAYRGRIPVGDVVMYQSFFMMIVGAVSSILNIYPILTRGIESIRSMGEILECPDIEENRGKKHVASVRGDIMFRNVELTYEKSTKPAVCNFTLDVKAGETVALIGESGSGKTSVMNLLVGF
ncbi:MAG: ATP-binding cassette domain-containing protein, partial [Chitinivibrionales bacterium]|nr:ATP-binding cassette domain-containing protein [Chitinivibrionales bacterium]MBD3356947.1 ATP-binding cassette domain-containing protein [Chitinivibrionales bacterium]